MDKYFIAACFAGFLLSVMSLAIKPEFPKVKIGFFVIGVTLVTFGLSLWVVRSLE